MSRPGVLTIRDVAPSTSSSSSEAASIRNQAEIELYEAPTRIEVLWEMLKWKLLNRLYDSISEGVKSIWKGYDWRELQSGRLPAHWV